MTFKILRNIAEYSVQKLKKNSAVVEGDGSRSCRKQSEGQTDNKILFNKLRVFDIFILLAAKIMQYWLVMQHSLKVWVSFNMVKYLKFMCI